MVLVTDANFWIDLYEGSLIHIAMRANYEWTTTDLISTEIEEKGRPVLNVLTDSGLAVVSLEGLELEKVVSLSSRYPAPSVEDLSAVVLANRLTTTLVTGDKRLRQAAEAERIAVHGTLWVIDRLVSNGNLTPREAARSLQAMQASDRRLPHAEVQGRLKKWLRNDG